MSDIYLPDDLTVSTTTLVLQALEKGLQIHGGDGFCEGVYSVMVTTTTTKKIIVLAVGTDADQETALRYALIHSLKRAALNVKPFPMKAGKKK